MGAVMDSSIDGLANSGNVLFAYDAFHGTLLMNALTMVVGVLPGLTAMVLLYYITTSFIAVVMTDRNFLRWGMTVIVALLSLQMLLGGLALPSSGSPTILSAGSTSNQITKMLFARNPGAKAQPVGVSAYAMDTFESYAYLGDSEVLAADFGNFSAPPLVHPKEMVLYSLTPADAAQHKQLGMSTTWEALNARLAMNPMTLKLTMYLFNAATSFQYAAHNTANLAYMNGVNDKILEHNASLKTASFIQDLRQSMPNGSPSTVKEYATYFRDIDESLNATLERHLRFSEDPTEDVMAGYAIGEGNVRLTSLSLADPFSPTTLSRYVGESSTNSIYANMADWRKYESFIFGHEFEHSLENVEAAIYAKSRIDAYVSLCMKPATELEGLDVASQMASTNLIDRLNPAGIFQKSSVKYGQLSTDVFNISIAEMVNIFFGGGSASIDLTEFMDVNYNITSQLRYTPTRANTLDDLLRQYDELLARTDPEIIVNSGCLQTGRKITQSIKDSLEQRTVYRNAADASFFNSSAPQAVCPEVLDFASNDLPSSTSEEDRVYVAITDYDDSSPPTSGNENHAGLSAALRSLLGPLASTYQEVKYIQDVTHPVSQDQTVAQVTATKEATKNRSSWDVGGIAYDYYAKKVNSVSDKVSEIASMVDVKAITTALFGTVTQLLGLVPIGAVMSAYTVAYYTVVFSSAFAVFFIPLWILMTGGRIIMNSTASDEAYQGFALFPIVKLVLMIVMVGIELAAVTAAAGATVYFTKIGGITTVKALGSVFGATAMGAVSMQQTGGGGGGFEIDFVTKFKDAMLPLGTIFGVLSIPAMFATLVRGDIYNPRTKTDSAAIIKSGAAAQEASGKVSRMFTKGV